ncbi:MAG: tetratricopeptide repeat protein [Pseudomonadota bacterium]
MSLVLGTLAACAPPDLPPLLPVSTDGFLPVVQEQIAEAIAAVNDRPGNADLNGELGMILTAYRQFTAAARSFQRARLLDDDEFRWAYYHGMVLKAGGEPAASLEAFEAALAIRPDHTMTRVRMATILLTEGEYERCAMLLGEALKANPGHALGLLTQGQLLLREGEYEGALRTLNRARSAAEGDSAVYFALAEAHRHLGDSAQATANFATYERLRSANRQEEDPLMQRLYAMDATDAPLVAQARRLYAGGRLDQAAASLDEALRRNPDSLQAHMALIGILAEQGDFAGSDEHYEKAYALAPTLPQLHFNLGVARQREGRMVEAAQAFEKALELDPNDTASLLQLASLAEGRGRTADAMRRYGQALAIDGSLQRARLPLAELMLERGDAQGVVDLLTQPSANTSQLPASALLSLGTAYLELGQSGEAREVLLAGRKAADAQDAGGVGLRIDAALRSLEATE